VPEWSNGTVLPARGWSALGGKTYIQIMHYVYIIYSKNNGQIYKGLTDDLRNRINVHNAGKVKATKNGKPWILVYYQAFTNKTDARREELFLKTGRGRERVKYLLQETFSPEADPPWAEKNKK